MKFALRPRHTVLAELNLTPLLDLVFVLLVIFIITTPQMMNHLELALPAGKADLSRPAALARICVVGRNQIQLDACAMDWAGFKAELARRKTAQPDLAAVVEGADTANYQAVVDVLEVIQQLNITQTGLATSCGDALKNQ
jgi:biopolymer transport protein ExbD